MDNLSEIKEVTIKELVESIVKGQSEMEALEAQVKVLKDEVHDRLTAMKVTGTRVNGYYVSRVRRVMFPDVSMEQAKELGAVVTKKDDNKLRALLDKGIELKAKYIEFVSIRKAKNE